MEIVYHDSLPSTHRFLEAGIRDGSLSAPLAIIADKQTEGIGSRGSAWQGGEGNLFLSFCFAKNSLPSDLPLASISLYYAWLMKSVLKDFGSKVWLKWPNDFYLRDKKVGGAITTVISDKVILVSLGINIMSAAKEFETIDIKVEKSELIEKYFLKLKEVIFWKDIFSQYQIEFEKSKRFFYTDKSTKKKMPLSKAVLLEDGAIMIDNKRIYSLR